MKSLWLLIAVLPGLYAVPAGATRLSRPTDENVASALVRVRSRCPKKNRQGQGFLIEGGRRVVTVRHLVAGCSAFSVDLYTGDDHDTIADTLTARLTRTLKAEDLALLELPTPATALPALSWQSDPPAAGTGIYVVARWLGASGITAAEMEVAFGSRKLRSHIDGMQAVMTEIERVGSPSLELDIVNLTKSIVPGTSGSPIVDGNGTVVAIADGGLKGGITGVNWAIPAHHVNRLKSSAEPLPTIADAGPAGALFSAEPDPTQVTTLSCGAYQLTRLRSLSFAEATALSDDPGGLVFLLSQTTVNPATIRFDVYEHLATGAAVVVPQGITLSSINGECAGSSLNGRIRLRLRIDPAADLITRKAVTSAFELSLLDGAPGWMEVKGFTYAMPTMRFDGLMVWRKLLARYDASPFPLPIPPSPRRLIFETLAGRGDTAMGIAASFNAGDFDLNQMLMLCLPGSTTDACAEFSIQRNAWGAAMIAVHLSTFSRGAIALPGSGSSGGGANTNSAQPGSTAPGVGE